MENLTEKGKQAVLKMRSKQRGQRITYYFFGILEVLLMVAIVWTALIAVASTNTVFRPLIVVSLFLLYWVHAVDHLVSDLYDELKGNKHLCRYQLGDVGVAAAGVAEEMRKQIARYKQQ